ncbi:MAG: alanine racemase [Patescibacteria group bacterium]|nr:alanine racemase [Patescibacteria group bacterium]
MTNKLKLKLIKNQYRTWLEIDTKAIKNNYQIFRNLIPKGCKLCGVVKSNAYGHGLVDFSKELECLDIDFLAVDSVVEGLRLRKEGIKTPILVLGYTLPSLVKKAAINSLSLTISSFDAVYSLPKLLGRKKIKIHLKLDTGMHRQGFYEDDAQKVLNFLSKNKNIILEGTYTHFAGAKNPAFPQNTKKQLAIFQKWIKELSKKGCKPICHAAATAGTILFPEARLDMARVGIGLYGLWPSKEIKAFAAERLKLKPAMRWKTIIGEIKNLSKGERIGYDFTERVDQNSKIAILPVGYWHGYPRSLSSIGYVLVQGKRCKILGRISMDMIIINISDVPRAKVGDEVYLLGKSGQEKVSADDLAYLSDTVNYEIVTRINPLIKKIYL